MFHRTVTVASDEGLCLSTLLSLDVAYIAGVQDRDERMARVWREIARVVGGIPPRVIFYEDNTIPLPGWRWAPRSLLGSAFPSWIDLNTKATRFGNFEIEGFAQPTELGLRVQFPGARLEPRPHWPDIPLHPWEGILKRPLEDTVYVYDEANSRWMQLTDMERSWVIYNLDEEGQEQWDRKANNPICRAIHQGNAALIYDHKLATTFVSKVGNIIPCLLVHTEDPPPGITREFDGLRAQRCRTVMLAPLDKTDSLVAEVFDEIAKKVANTEASRDMILIEDRTSETYKNLLETVKSGIKAEVAEVWRTRPDFVQAVHNTLGADMEEWVWAGVPKLCSHRIIATDLPVDQVWLVD
jgi:hypothetical protein